MNPLGWAYFDPRALIWTNMVYTHKKKFHALYLSSSYLGFLKEFFFIQIREIQWPPGAGQILTPGHLFEQTW
jgi:hypothetical protein